ncbi:rlx protein, partial [Blautia wexlerae]|nr:rlx protein [Blautia wexlerae]MZS90972.1 rlx protein [Blautia wexlerae]
REMLKYAKQYQKNKIYDDHYKSSKDPDRYFRKYESQIILFAGAEHILQENGMDLKHLNTNKLQEQLSDLISQKKSLNTQYVSFKQEIKELELIHQNLSKYLKQDAPEIQRSSHNKLPSL